MAYIRKRKRKKGMVYTATIRLTGHPPESQSFDRISEAHVWAEKREEEIKLGIPVEGEAEKGDIHLGEATDKYLQSVVGKSDNTINDYRYSQTQLLKYFGEKTLLGEITTPDMSKYIAKRMNRDGVGASKIRAELTMVRMTYEKAAEWGVVLDSPEKNIPRPTVRKKSREDKLTRVVGPDELNALLDEAKHRCPSQKSIRAEYLVTHHPLCSD